MSDETIMIDLSSMVPMYGVDTSGIAKAIQDSIKNDCNSDIIENNTRYVDSFMIDKNKVLKENKSNTIETLPQNTPIKKHINDTTIDNTNKSIVPTNTNINTNIPLFPTYKRDKVVWWGRLLDDILLYPNVVTHMLRIGVRIDMMYVVGVWMYRYVNTLLSL